MCTPWKTKRSGSSLNDKIPLQRRMLGPSVATRSCTQGKNLSGLSGLSLLRGTAAMMMNVIFPVFMLVHVHFLGLEEGGLDVEDAVEVEGIAAEHFGDVDLGALGAVQPGVRIDGADARLDFGELRRRHQVG